MFSKESLYINAIKYAGQLKLNYKKLKNNDIIETDSLTFITDKNDSISSDISDKINLYSSKTGNSYISTLLIQEDTKLIKKDKDIPSDYEIAQFNSNYNLAVAKNTLFETQNYFEKCGVDYIFSAYHVLNLHIEENPCNNNLVVLLFNDQAFCIILNENNEIVFHDKFNLTPFEEIKDSGFYENELLGQKLYDQVYALELRQIIQNALRSFYKSSKDTFIEKISILYNIKLVSDEAITSMKDEFMMDLTYHPILIDEELFELSRDTHKDKSFIKPRQKQKKGFGNIFLTLFILTIILVVAFKFTPIDEVVNNFSKNIESKSNIFKKDILLSNHIQVNNIIKNRIKKSFDSIPYDVVLDDFELNERNLEMSANILHKDTFIKVLKPELEKLYENSTITFDDESKSILNAKIEANNPIDDKPIMKKVYNDVYIENEFISILRVTEQIKMLFSKDTIVTFKSNKEDIYSTYDYIINIVIKTPLEFYNIIDMLNNELYSVNVTFPISFVKTNNGIKVEFILQFHQPK